MSNENASFTPQVDIKSKGKMLELRWTYRVYYNDKHEKVSCYIPGLDIYYSSKDKAAMRHKAATITKMFFDHYMVHTKNGLKNLILELHKLGYKSSDNYAYLIHRIAKNDFSSSKFKISNREIPNDFIGAENIIDESKMEVAAL